MPSSSSLCHVPGLRLDAWGAPVESKPRQDQLKRHRLTVIRDDKIPLASPLLRAVSNTQEMRQCLPVSQKAIRHLFDCELLPVVGYCFTQWRRRQQPIVHGSSPRSSSPSADTVNSNDRLRGVQYSESRHFVFISSIWCGSTSFHCGHMCQQVCQRGRFCFVSTGTVLFDTP